MVKIWGRTESMGIDQVPLANRERMESRKSAIHNSDGKTSMSVVNVADVTIAPKKSAKVIKFTPAVNAEVAIAA